jgi:hypothetical protein
MTDKLTAETKKCRVTYRDGEPTDVIITTVHCVDDYYETTFTFKMEGSTAFLHSITAPGDRYFIEQNEPARIEARKTVENLPFVQAVEIL